MGRPDKVIFLLAATVNNDDIGNQVLGYGDQRMIFAEEIYLGTNEFYQAAVAGMKPEKRFEIYAREYQGEKKLVYDGITYNIIRTTIGKSKEKLWLICERVIGDG